MWVFLVTEIMFFGGMFAAYIVYRSLYPAAFETGSHFLDVQFGATNTAVLICSSLTMALAIRSAQTGKSKIHDHVSGRSDDDPRRSPSSGSKLHFEWYHDYVEAHSFPGIRISDTVPSGGPLAPRCRCSCASISS